MQPAKAGSSIKTRISRGPPSSTLVAGTKPKPKGNVIPLAKQRRIRITDSLPKVVFVSASLWTSLSVLESHSGDEMGCRRFLKREPDRKRTIEPQNCTRGNKEAASSSANQSSLSVSLRE